MNITNEILTRRDLSANQKLIYAFLADQGSVVEGITNQALADAIGMARKSVTNNLPILIEKGLIRIENSSSNGWRETSIYYVL